MVKPAAGLRFGLTSSDVGDTCYAVQMVQSADILIGDVKKLLPVIARRAKEHKFTPCIGRSHGIHGEPTTFGLKMALMHDEFGRALERLERAREIVAVGKIVRRSRHWYALSPRVEEFVCKNLDKNAPIAASCPARRAFTRNFKPRARARRREHRTGRLNSAICNEPKFSKPKSLSRKGKRVRRNTAQTSIAAGTITTALRA